MLPPMPVATTGDDRPIRVLVAPDKYKGSLTAAEVAHRIGRGLAEGAGPGRIVGDLLPLADGGDGSVDAAIAAGHRAVALTVTGPTGRPVRTTAAVDGDTAVVEVAATSGLGLLPDGRLDALGASSRGVGEAIRHVHGLGARRIVVALGGSATTDGGAGMLAALGVRFLASDGTAVRPSGGSLSAVARLDLTGLLSLDGVELVGASDVTNPLTGILGAARVFGPQKGADAAAVDLLDAGLAHLVDLAERAGIRGARAAATTPGAGSAGGIGYALLLLGGRLVSGAGFFLDLLGFDARARAADLVITGEGSMDEQTRDGKLISVVVARSAGRPVIAVVGRDALSMEGSRELGLHAVHALADLTDEDSSRDPALSARLLERIGRDIADALATGAVGRRAGVLSRDGIPLMRTPQPTTAPDPSTTTTN